jgi:biotin transport system substrate-specific component
MTVYTALFVALIAMGAFIIIPIGPVPIVLQNLFVLLAGLVLGPFWGLACIAIYLLMGVAGLPVFSGGTAGIGRIFGPTGGYLLGYLPAVVVTGTISQWFNHTRAGRVAALAAGALVVYGAGVPWLKVVLNLSWSKALAVGMYPFLLGDSLKIATAAYVAERITRGRSHP